MDLESFEHILPESLRQVSALIGYENTLKLIKSYGGTTFIFNKDIESISFKQLSQLIGYKSSAQLHYHFYGNYLYIPNASVAIRELRNQCFIRDYKALVNGWGSRRIALAKLCPKYGFSERHAWGVLSRYK
ncbi:Mor transcription activator family protein [Providencia alcalifaciens]|uniref:Mor transcription activator family protein n=1 Tax=Providencia alcalifaciens TaxID=126385 RepID=UPI001CC643AC|nr:Mor transcription activator family protein [Providencia alcalifaciens]CAG9436572.1 hypothetical protein NVI2019_OGMBKCAO_04040 [Providencia alcalifaciens]CAG9436617.1 hypothetical protein NVI2019_KOLGMIGM_04049 [Providencia alcalifaciens]CAG9436631.1 hypothetical protein NVI2019_PLFLNFOB_04047 [Providencia alcalifaciens]CAG9436653.1 hypothetical protein NVI2019_ANGEOOBF_04048 [Providencia alcalifaciens]CAG9437557.1 hypothetical protein NVI2019_OHEONHNH_04047 [Providencia alcalifaciens]